MPHALTNWIGGPFGYLAITLGAMIEGEVAYVAAATLVAHGQLSAAWVILAGTIGAAGGDQAYFYAFRHRLPRWMARYPKLQQAAAPLVQQVGRHETLMVLLIRFAPGLRIAITAACAYVDVSAVKFSLLNTATAFVWAILVLILVADAGPSALSSLGMSGWKAGIAIGLSVFLLLRLVGSLQKRWLRS